VHLVSGKAGRGLGFTQINATSCLLAAAAAKPLVALDGPENENQLKKILGWSGATNAFAGFDKLLEQAGGDGAMTLVYHSDDWKHFTDAGGDTRFDRTGLQPAGGAERDFTELLPSHFGLRPEEWSSFGAQIELLPRPAVEAGGQNNAR